MIRITDLTFTYPGAKSPALNHLNLHVEKGDFLAVIGNNGCGKSTLCKTLNGLIPHFITGDMQGEVLIHGMDTKEYSVGEMAKNVGYVYQDFENQIVRPTVLDDASFSCLNYAVEDYEYQGMEALKMCGLEAKAQDYIWQLSGGQKHLLALAGAAALKPEILILDEPIAQLDPFHARQTYEILKDLNETYGKTIIVIEHHTEFIADYCKNAVLMKNGKIAWKLPAKEALRRVKDLEESSIYPPQTAVAAKRLQEMGLLSKELPLPTTVEEGKEIYEKENFHPKKFGKEQRVSSEEIVVEFKNVSVGYRAVKGENAKIFDDFSLHMKKGEKIALIGSNGAGKSTLLKLMIGLLKPSKGSVELQGVPTKKMSPEEMSRLISLVYQNPEEMFIKDSIEADIAYAMKARNLPDWETRTRELLEMFQLTELKDRDGRLLSGGQMRRASLAIGIALNPGILLLDEPTANLDIATRHEILHTLEQLKEVTETVVIATHDMQLVCQWADRILVLYQGKLIADGTRNEIFQNQKVVDLVGICPPEIYAMGKALSEEAQCYTVEDFIQCFKEEEDVK
ncbi:MAG: energy-coupling factor transporter ATPase [Lachnospiraceae bacterium]|nr:energy-coupling factor transporter ATPase [Lachnospiraceae bacterium]